MRLLSADFPLSHVWQLPYKIVRVLIIKHYAVYIERGTCSPLLDVGSQIWEDFGLIAFYLALRCWLDGGAIFSHQCLSVRLCFCFVSFEPDIESGVSRSFPWIGSGNFTNLICRSNRQSILLHLGLGWLRNFHSIFLVLDWAAKIFAV
jgi:hypothetical protein